MYTELCTQVSIVMHAIFHYVYGNGVWAMTSEAGGALGKSGPGSAPRGVQGPGQLRDGLPGPPS